MNSKELKKRQNEINDKSEDIINKIEEEEQEIRRVINIIDNTGVILDDLDIQFCKQTGFTNLDVSFLFLAIGLQIARQYLLSNEKFRLTASKGDELMKNVLSPLYDVKPEWKKVLTQSVPYDAFIPGGHIKNTGLGGTTHRYRTLGHDPIFGWIFGTANIMTNSLTKTDFETYQVKNMKIIRRYPSGTSAMFQRTIDYSINDPKLLVASVARQAIHFGSDYFTKQGLPVPGIAMFDNQLAQKMVSNWHIDTWSVTRGALLSSFINQLIVLIHGLFFEGKTDMDKKLYEVRTRKILSYSNLIATSSNVAIVAVTHDMQKLDVGGMAVTIYRLITDKKFIREIKKEFVFGEFQKMIQGE